MKIEELNKSKLSPNMIKMLEDFKFFVEKQGELQDGYSEESMKEMLEYITNNISSVDREKYVKEYLQYTDLNSPIRPIEFENVDNKEKTITAFSFDNSNLKLIKISNPTNKLEITNDGRILLNGVLFFDNIKLQESLKFLTKPSKIKKVDKVHEVVDELKKLEIFS